MFLLYRVLFCNFAISGQIFKTFLGLISCKCCNILFSLHVNVSIVIRSVVTKQMLFKKSDLHGTSFQSSLKRNSMLITRPI